MYETHVQLADERGNACYLNINAKIVSFFSLIPFQKLFLTKMFGVKN